MGGKNASRGTTVAHTSAIDSMPMRCRRQDAWSEGGTPTGSDIPSLESTACERLDWCVAALFDREIDPDSYPL